VPNDLNPIRSIEPGQPAVVRLAGELDGRTAPALRAGLEELLHAGHTELLVDLAGVSFADSIGIGVLFGGLKKGRQRHGRLDLAAPKAIVAKIVRISALDQVLTIHASPTTSPRGSAAAIATEFVGRWVRIGKDGR
jgi:anti-sigma B factor antagonist